MSLSNVRRLPALLLSITLLFASAVGAETEDEIAAKRLQWQDRYRVLLQNQAILKQNIAKLRKNYAQAQRRNYPRGGAREAFRIKADEQEVQLGEIQRELENVFTEARAADVPPGWLYEVDEEPLDLSSAPAAKGALDRDSDDDSPEDDGRNPLYDDADRF